MTGSSSSRSSNNSELEQLSSELLELKPSELQKRAWASGASEVAVATAWDSPDHKNALVELIIKHGGANPAFMMMGEITSNQDNLRSHYLL